MHDVVNPFTYYTPTKVLFGKDSIQGLPEAMAKYGRRVLLVYGGGSIKKTGLYDTVKTLLRDFEIFELAGVEPNPRVNSVNEGGRLCREHNIEMVLAVGGGSVIDCAKVICDAVFYQGDAWDLVKDSSKVSKALPLFTVLTLAATGSEFNCGAVISNLEAREKLGVVSALNYPKVSVLDPTYTMSVGRRQTAAGSADIISHVLEQYLVSGTAMAIEGLCESILRTVIKFGPLACEHGDDYTARANLMWAGSLACNGTCSLGFTTDAYAWAAHAIEHELSAFYDITHGEGLAILAPVLMRYCLNDSTVDRWAAFAARVFGINKTDKFEAARAGIKALEGVFAAMGLPRTLREAGITEKVHFREMAEHACLTFPLHQAYVPLDPDKVCQILELAY